MPLCDVMFDHPHAYTSQKQAQTSIGLIICEQEQEANSYDVHPLPPKLIVIFSNKSHVMLRVAIPWEIAPNALVYLPLPMVSIWKCINCDKIDILTMEYI